MVTGSSWDLGGEGREDARQGVVARAPLNHDRPEPQRKALRMLDP